MSRLTKIEWNILDCLSDGVETVGLVFSMTKLDFPHITIKEIAENIFRLYQRELVTEDKNKKVDLKILLKESDDYRENIYWFGLSHSGCKYWEDYAKEYKGESIDWSQAWHVEMDFKRLEGYIDGVSLEACLIGIEKINTEKDWQVDKNTLVNSRIEVFKAKYYKEIKGGYRTTFKIKKNIY
jgi:hypothetical protein